MVLTTHAARWWLGKFKLIRVRWFHSLHTKCKCRRTVTEIKSDRQRWPDIILQHDATWLQWELKFSMSDAGINSRLWSHQEPLLCWPPPCNSCSLIRWAPIQVCPLVADRQPQIVLMHEWTCAWMFIEIAISNPIGKFHGSKNILEADDIDGKLSKNISVYQNSG